MKTLLATLVAGLFAVSAFAASPTNSSAAAANTNSATSTSSMAESGSATTAKKHSKKHQKKHKKAGGTNKLLSAPATQEKGAGDKM